MTPRVALLIGAYPPSTGGAQVHTRALASELAGRAVVAPEVSTLWRTTRSDWVTAATRPVDPKREVDVVDGVPVHELGLERTSRWDDLARLAYLPARRLAAEHFAGELSDPVRGADVVHAIRLGREHLALRGLNVARANGIPFVLTANHHPKWSRRFWPDPVWRRLYRQADAVFALTNTEATMLTDLGVNGDRIVVTGIGPLIAQEAARPPVLDDDAGRFILFLGQQYSYKRLDLVVDAYQQLARRDPALRLVIAGPPHRDSVQLLDALSTDPRVYPLGMVSEPEKHWLLENAGVLVFASEQESFGGVVVEAAAVGCPVVVGAVPAVAEVVKTLEWGRATDGTLNSVTQAVAETLAQPPSATERARVIERANARFSWSSLAQRYENAYLRLL